MKFFFISLIEKFKSPQASFNVIEFLNSPFHLQCKGAAPVPAVFRSLFSAQLFSNKDQNGKSLKQIFIQKLFLIVDLFVSVSGGGFKASSNTHFSCRFALHFPFGMARRRPPRQTRCYVSTFCRFDSLFAHVNLLALCYAMLSKRRSFSKRDSFAFLSSFLMCKPLAFTVALMYVVLWLFYVCSYSWLQKRQTLAFCLGIFVSLLIWPSPMLRRNFYLHFFLLPRRGRRKQKKKLPRLGKNFPTRNALFRRINSGK